MRKIGVIVGILLFLYGGGAFVNSLIQDVHTTIQWYLQVGGFLVGGAVLIISSVYMPENLSMPKQQIVKEKEMTGTTVPLTDEQLSDLQALNHLTVRLKEDKDSMDLLRQLHAKIFELHYGKKTA